MGERDLAGVPCPFSSEDEMGWGGGGRVVLLGDRIVTPMSSIPLLCLVRLLHPLLPPPLSVPV